MVDQDVIIGAGVAFAGLAVGAGMVAFTEAQGERTAERGAISADVSGSDSGSGRGSSSSTSTGTSTSTTSTTSTSY